VRVAATFCLVVVTVVACGTAVAGGVADERLVIGRLPCAGGESPGAHGLRQLVWELTKRTSVEAEPETVAVDPADSGLYKTPFLLWSCKGAVADLDDRALANLRRFLVMGGFLWVDDPAAAPGGEFDRSIRFAIARLFPGRRLEEVQAGHVVFKTFFLISRPAGRVATAGLEGLSIDKRLAIVYTHGDLLGALAKDLYGGWEQVCEPGGEVQREESYRLAIDIVFYALCLDYKNDRVHLQFILKRRRL